jgi:arylsulfatase A-like enzyme
MTRVGRRQFLNAAAATGFAAAVSGRASRAQSKRPNFLFILADDLGYGDLSCYGRPEYRTPVLDALARDGMRFTSAYAAAPVCTPTRCALATGRYPQRVAVGLREPLTDADREHGLPPDQPTLALLLKRSGYETALIGKWHLGWKPEFGPNRHGYDEFYGILSGAGDYFTHGRTGNEADFWENLQPIQRAGYMTDLLSDRAAAYVTRRRTSPFLLSLHYTAPLSRWEGPGDATLDHESHGPGPMIAGGSLAVYAAMVQSMDTGIGRVLQALRKSGRERDTLVIFTSDNGGERYSFNWPFSFQKFFLWEGGIRVPAIARWPGTIPPGRTSDQALITMDWTATMLALAGASPDPAFPLDGDDVTPVCTGQRPVYDRTLFWRTQTHAAARVGRWKYLDNAGTESLFDLSIDPGEKNELRAARAEVFENLRAQYQAWASGMLPRLPRSAK